MGGYSINDYGSSNAVMDIQADGKFFFRLSGQNLDAIQSLKVVCKDSDGEFVISEPGLDEEESTETEYRYKFIYDGDSETLSYDCFILNGEQKFLAYGSTYRL